jgi:elongation factor P hydroxylase
VEEKLSRVVDLFHRLFGPAESGSRPGVRLVGGFSEPFYRAPTADAPAEIRFTRDYLNSCFHEIAHWCIAGEARRRSDDYGYWYSPDGRNGEEQRAFFRAEAGPQALEWAFAVASGAEFRMSCDNLAGEVRGEAEFAAALRGQLQGYLKEGFPPRGEKFLAGLMKLFHPQVDSPERDGWLAARILAMRRESA